MEDPIAPQEVPVPPTQKTQDEFSGTEGVYLLPHHQEEIKRLQRQHGFIKAATAGSLTHVELPPNARVLDCGCADGTWLADLAGLEQTDTSSRNDLSLHGADLGGALFRANPSLDLRTHDIRTPFPESWGWNNGFDLVHQRLLVWGIGKEEWPAVLSNISSTVKSGGYIQLVEAEWVLPSYAENMPQIEKLGRVQEWSAALAGFDVHIWKRLPQLLQDVGFADVQVETFDLGYGATSTRPEDRQWTAELLPQSFRHLARLMKDEQGIPGVAQTPEEYMQWLEKLSVEMSEIGYTPKLKWVIARKA